MKKIFILAIALAMIVVSCQTDFSNNTIIFENNSDKNSQSFSISEEQALARLESFLSTFDSDQTRSKNRSVKSINCVKCSDIYNTRSSTNDIEDLFYIVEFEDNMGSAVIGADSRIDQVFAVLDCTVLTAADFNNNNSNDITSFVANIITMDAINSINTYNLLPDEELRTDITYRKTYYTLLNEIKPLLATQWNQSDPYNSKFNEELDEDTNTYFTPYVGCTTIALAQILNYHKIPASIISVGNKNFYWSLIGQNTIYASSDLSVLAKNHLYEFLYSLTSNMKHTYKLSGTYIPVSEAMNVMKRCGYKKVDYISMTAPTAYNMVLYNKPVFVYGRDTKNTTNELDDDEHAWVIDGWKDIKTCVYEYVEDNNIIISSKLVSQEITAYPHCNMGWGGDCSGYYKYGLFNTTRVLENDMIEDQYGDEGGTNTGNYRTNFSIIKYNL